MKTVSSALTVRDKLIWQNICPNYLRSIKVIGVMTRSSVNAMYENVAHPGEVAQDVRQQRQGE
ncbi:MAG TPA: hypothetical protein VHK70_07300, partial [Burkholderiaceae bacterium]|nr:hypothetical protein [Burkholderiaceae bacterium]